VGICAAIIFGCVAPCIVLSLIQQFKTSSNKTCNWYNCISVCWLTPLCYGYKKTRI